MKLSPSDRDYTSRLARLLLDAGTARQAAAGRSLAPLTQRALLQEAARLFSRSVDLYERTHKERALEDSSDLISRRDALRALAGTARRLAR